MSFRVINSAQNALSNRLNFDTIPRMQSHAALQVGDYKISARSDDINGWLVCDGRSLLRSQYPALFAVIGTDFGTDDSLHFCLPDYTSKVIGMYGPSAEETNWTVRERGEVVGQEEIFLTVPQLPAHSHTGATDSNGSHNHTIGDIPDGTQTISALGGGSTTAADETRYTGTTSSAGAHTHNFTTGQTGQNQAIDNMQPTLFGATVLIFAKFLNRLDLSPTTWKV
jgi:microcystin-dependent protein